MEPSGLFWLVISLIGQAVLGVLLVRIVLGWYPAPIAARSLVTAGFGWAFVGVGFFGYGTNIGEPEFSVTVSSLSLIVSGGLLAWVTSVALRQSGIKMSVADVIATGATWGVASAVAFSIYTGLYGYPIPVLVPLLIQGALLTAAGISGALVLLLRLAAQREASGKT